MLQRASNKELQMQKQLGIYKAETEVKEYINNIINEEVSKYIYIFIDKR